MDRNSVIGLLLIGVILIGFSYFYSGTEEGGKTDGQTEQIADSTQETDKKQVVEKEATADASDTLMADADTAVIDSAKLNARKFSIETDYLKVKLNTLGGFFDQIQVKDYQTFDSLPLILVDENSNQFNYKFNYGGKLIETKDLVFETDAEDIQLFEDDTQSIVLRAQLPDGGSIEKHFTFKSTSYRVGYELRLVGLDDKVRTESIALNWNSTLRKQEKVLESERQNTALFYKLEEEGVDDISGEDSKESFEAPLQWLSFKQQFFNQSLFAEDFSFVDGKVSTSFKEKADYVKKLQAELNIPIKHLPEERFKMHFYLGPNKFKYLKKDGEEFTEILPLGWAVFGWINKYVILTVFNLFNSFIGNYGVIIILLTILIKLALSPLTYRSYLSQAKMRLLKPELDALKEKMKGNQQKMQMEQMKLYNQAGVNPLGGCLPQLLQFPILISMFRFFPASIELRQKSFLWADDLSTYDSVYNFPGGFEIPFYGDHISLFTLLMAASTMLYSWYNQKNSPTANDQMAQQMKLMIYIMPIFLLFFFNSYSAGLSAYYLTYNLLSFGQTYVFKLIIDENKLKQKIDEKRKNPSNKKSRLQKRMEEMTKRQNTPGKKGK